MPFEARLRIGQCADKELREHLKGHGFIESRTRSISMTSEGPDNKKQKNADDKERKKEEERRKKWKPSMLSYAARAM